MATPPKRQFHIALAAALILGLALYLLDPFLGNVAFLIAGALVGIYAQFKSDDVKRVELRSDLARAYYEELANRVGRCLFDFESPWEKFRDAQTIHPHEMDLERLRKFSPVEPTIYPATAGQIAVLGGLAPQAIIRFYTRLAILSADIEIIARSCEQQNYHFVPADRIATIAERFRRTLAPGLEALRALSILVDGNEKIDAAQMEELDAMFRHERSHLPLKQRLAHYVEAPQPATST
jgi:hypothetical protein